MMRKNQSPRKIPRYIDPRRGRISPLQVYAVAGMLCIVALLCCFAFSRGAVISRYFYQDTSDTGMDFFHSIEYTRGRRPYEQYGTLYPPLANLFFYVIYLMVPSNVAQHWGNTFSESLNLRNTAADLRLDQAPLMAYFFFLMVCVIFLYAMIDYALRDERRGCAKWAAAAMILSYGSLYAVERGNIVLLCVALCLVFVLFYRSESKMLKEIALLSLAVSAGLKLYPALLGVLLIKEKDWKAATRCVIYGVCSVILPMFAFEGLSALQIWLGQTVKFSNKDANNWRGTGVDRIVNNAVRLIGMAFSVTIPEASVKGLGLIVCALLCGCALLMKKDWKSITALTLAMLLVQSQGNYVLCLLLVPLVMFFREEKRLTRGNIVPFVALTLLTVNVPLFYEYGVTDPRNDLTQLMLVVLSVWCVCTGVRDGIARSRPSERQGGNKK